MMRHIEYQKKTDMGKIGLNMKWTWLLTCAMCLWTMALYAAVPQEWDKNNIERLEYRMNIKARVHKDGEAVKMSGSVVAVFMGEQLRAVKEYDNGDGYYYFNLTVYAEEEEEEGYTFKFYDSVKDKVYDLKIPAGMEPLPYKRKGYGQFATDGSGTLEPFVLTLPTYFVTVENGAAEPARACVGDTVTVTAVAPGEHKVFMGWTGTDVVFADANAMTTSLTMPAKNVTVTAVFEDEKEYDYTVVNGATPSGKAFAGATVNLEAPDRTAEHLIFTGWTGSDGVTFANPKALKTSFTMPAKDVTMTATYVQEGKVRYVVVNGTTAGGEDFAGAVVSVTAKAPAAHKIFKEWRGDGVTFANPKAETTTFTLPQSDGVVTVTAVFDDEAKYDYTVVNGTPASGKAYANDTVAITAADRTAEHLIFDKWTGDVAFADASSSVTSFTMPAKAVTVTATYREEGKFTVTVNGGAANPTAAFKGQTVTLTVDAADANKHFVRWTSNDVAIINATSSPATFTMPEKNVSVTAVYEYKVTVAQGTSDKAFAESGASVKITAADRTAEHLVFDKWTGDVAFDDASSSVTSFVMPAKAVTVTATYKDEPQYTVTVNGGTSDKAKAYAGETVTVTANEPAEGETFRKWTGDVAFADAASTVTSFTMPAKNVTVTANFSGNDGILLLPGWNLVAAPGDLSVDDNQLLFNELNPFALDRNSMAYVRASLPLASGEPLWIYSGERQYVQFVHEDSGSAVAGLTGGDGWQLVGVGGRDDVVLNNVQAAWQWRNGRWNPLEIKDGKVLLSARRGYFIMAPDGATIGVAEDWLNRYFNGKEFVAGDDADGDGLTNLQEYYHGTNPVNADTDCDGIPDGWEMQHGLKPLIAADGVADADGDGFTNLKEYQNGTDPNRPNYTVAVVDGTVDVSLPYAGDVVSITANEPAVGMVFDKWMSDDVEFEETTAATTTFVMPAKNVTVKATYMDDPNSLVLGNALYVVVDLSGGPDAMNYPVRYTNKAPNLDDDTCRTTELWLRRIPKGTFIMGSPEDEVGRSDDELQHQVTLTQDYYMGVFECTQRQWELVMGNRPSYYQNANDYATHPVEKVSYNVIRGSGSQTGTWWPVYGHAVYSSSFMGRLQEKTGLVFDLPTEAQWEYACRAGTMTALNSGNNLTNTSQDNDLISEVGVWFSSRTMKVGSYLPNAWGLYDMHGNDGEWCLDWYGNYGMTAEENPTGLDTGKYRVIRSGSFASYQAPYCRSASRYNGYPSLCSHTVGFRPVCLLDQVLHAVNMQNGMGNMIAANEGVMITIMANKPEDGMIFDKWISDDVEFFDATAMTTSFVMPAKPVTVIATYIPNPNVGDVDEMLYAVVDLSSGSNATNYPVRYTNLPPDLDNDACRTTELWLRRIPRGTFMMGSPADELEREDNESLHKVTLTQDYYIGVFECTQKQWELVMGNNPSYFNNASHYTTRPVEQVSYDMIRGTGKQAGAGWPAYGHAVDAMSFMGRLQTKTGLVFDLPTEAQWEYACRAGTTTALNTEKSLISEEKDPSLDKLGCYKYNKSDISTENGTAKVGSYMPNFWGLYDMHGNVFEWCLDWYGNYDTNAVIDPKGSQSQIQNQRVCRGGAWHLMPGKCRSASRNSSDKSLASKYVGFRVLCFPPQKLYAVIDLSSGVEAESYPVRYSEIGPDLNDDTCRTTELWLRWIPKGTFIMGSPEDEVGRNNDETQHEVMLTKDYYIGVFECTQKQWELVMGNNPSRYVGDCRPVEGVSYDIVRGNASTVGLDWPTYGHAVDAASFMGKLQAKTGLVFDLPTEAQWEYACRAGTTTSLNSGKNLSNQYPYQYQYSAMNEVGRYDYNHSDGKGGYSQHTKVGSYQPNAWGLYDMHGNVREWCLDWYNSNYGMDAVEDPLGPSSGLNRVTRGGSWTLDAYSCRSADRSYNAPSENNYSIGFRIVCLLQKVFVQNINVVNGISAVSRVGEHNVVTIMADEAEDGMLFDRWISDEVFFSNAMSPMTTFVMPARAVTITATYVQTPLYIVVDLAEGPNAKIYPRRYTDIDPDLDDDACRTTELWLRRIPKGTFMMGSPEDELGRKDNEIQHEVTLMQDYYIGVFECTQKQWELVMGSNPSYYVGDCRPVEYVSYSDIRKGTETEIDWPNSGHTVGESSFMGKLQTKTGLIFDLPTEAQWEYACRAGTTTALNSGKNLSWATTSASMDKVGRYRGNSDDGKGGYLQHTSVGSYLPNAWGLYDMHGNVEEWCLDWYNSNYGMNAVEDLLGPNTGTFRVIRSGDWTDYGQYCRSASRNYSRPSDYSSNFGFRVVCLP